METKTVAPPKTRSHSGRADTGTPDKGGGLMLGSHQRINKDVNMFTAAQQTRIAEVEAVLRFPLDVPCRHLSATMQDFNYTAFQTAFAIAWLKKGPNEKKATPVDRLRLSVTDQLKLAGTPKSDNSIIDEYLTELGVDDYADLVTPGYWSSVVENDEQSSEADLSERFTQFANDLLSEHRNQTSTPNARTSRKSQI